MQSMHCPGPDTDVVFLIPAAEAQRGPGSAPEGTCAERKSHGSMAVTFRLQGPYEKAC